MRHLTKKYFIPHPENNHQPHILRLEKTLLILGAIVLIESLFLVGIFFVFPSFDFFAAILPNILVDETNNNRAHAALSPLTSNELLAQAAHLKAKDMASKGYFAHTSPEGVTPWYWISQSGYEFVAAGENLAVNFFDSKDVAQAWMNSPSHRANILNAKFTEIGIATAQGMYKGKEAVFVVQFFGRPLPPAITQGVTAQPIHQTPTISAQPSLPTTQQTQELFTEIQGINIPIAQAQAPVQTPPSLTSPLERLMGAPRFATNFIYIVLASIITLALILKIFIKVNIQYPRLIGNGIFVLIAIASSLLLNYYIALQTHII